MSRRRIDGSPHYGWYIVAAGTLCVFAGLGLGRFALGMLLPSMAASLHLTYARMGLIGTVNFAGYLIAVLFCGPLTDRFGSRRLISLALLLVGISMTLISRADSFAAVLLLYLLTGMGSGASNVPMMALISAWFVSRQRGRAAGFVVIGSGFAILVTGQLIPWLNGLAGEAGWRLNWLVLGGVVILAAGVCLAVLRNHPCELGLTPVGSREAEGGGAGPALPPQRLGVRTILHLGAIYFLFGCTYVIYATFIVTVLVNERGFPEATAGTFWSWVGLLSLFSGPVFGTLSDRVGRKAGLIAVFIIQALAYLLIALNLPGLSLYLSIGFFGIVAWAIPSIMAALVGDWAGPGQAARVFGLITFIFAIGQICGPAVAGVLAEKSGGFGGSFWLAALLAATAALLSAALRPEGGRH